MPMKNELVKDHGITMACELIKPEVAKDWLENLNKGTGKLVNRKFLQRSVDFLFNQMKENNWEITADPIKFGKSGNLLDGQHTLMAIVKLNKPVPVFVARGVEDKVFSVLDTGKSRSAGDVLSMKGYKYASNLAGAVRSILLYEQGYYADPSKAGRISKATNAAVLKFVEKNEEIHEIMAYVFTVYDRFRFMNLSAMTMLYWELSKKNQAKCDHFFEKFATGIDLNKNDAIRMLREKFIKDSTNKSKLSTRDKTALFIMAWNSFLKNKPVEQLSFNKNYDFPKPI